MENKQNVVLAVVLSIGILIGWQYLFPPAAPVAPNAQTQASAARDPESTNTRAAEASKAANAGAVAGTATGRDAATPSGSEMEAVPSADEPERMVRLVSKRASYEFTTRGAALRSATLLGRKYRHTGEDGGDPDEGDTGEQVEIVRAPNSALAPFSISLNSGSQSLAASEIWHLEEVTDERIRFRVDLGDLQITKTFTLQADRFRLSMDVAIQNKSSRTQEHTLTLHLYGRQDPAKGGGSFFTYATASIEEMVCHVGGSIERENLDSLMKEPAEHGGTVRWIAADERFFALAAVAPVQAQSDLRKCGMRAHGPDTGEVYLSMAPKSLAAGQMASYPFELFAGAKYRDTLSKVTIPGEPVATAENALAAGDPAALDEIVNVNIAFLSRPLLALLKLLYRVTGNWGIAIILLTFLVRVATFYPAHKQLLSGKKMARLAPKMAELRKKYGNDKQKMGAETMNLYKTHGVNPLGGCLPALIQAPIWIALFSTLSYSVELYNSSFALHIQDLTVPDKYFAAPLIMGAVMSIQMRMSPAGADPQQQKIMAVMMPIMFTGFSLFLPAGLSLYTLTSYSLGIVHQLIVNRIDRKKNGPIVPIAQTEAAAKKPPTAKNAKANGPGKKAGKSHKG